MVLSKKKYEFISKNLIGPCLKTSRENIKSDLFNDTNFPDINVFYTGMAKRNFEIVDFIY